MEKEIVLSQPSGDALQALVDSFAENTQQVQERLSSAMESLMGKNNNTNLNLTYAVRDGIISHCGEVNQNAIKPRDEAISLDQYKTVNHYNPYTWEGCVVKYADKISIYKLLISSYDGLDTPNRIQSMALIYPDIFPLFADWIMSPPE